MEDGIPDGRAAAGSQAATWTGMSEPEHSQNYDTLDAYSLS